MGELSTLHFTTLDVSTLGRNHVDYNYLYMELFCLAFSSNTRVTELVCVTGGSTSNPTQGLDRPSLTMRQ
jgi:hypothetical protein